MAEATVDPSEAAALQDAAKAIDRARMKQIGSLHFTMVMAALTLWGAGMAWADASGLWLAQAVSVGNAVIAGVVIVSTIHEWGHFLGARLSGAESPVLEAPRRHFFMFDFPIDRNDARQFAWMSWGGILAPWVAVLAAAVLVPLDRLASVVLLATLVSRAVAAGTFEVPVVRGAAESGDPGGELGRRVSSGGLDRSRHVGYAAGVASFALLWLAA